MKKNMFFYAFIISCCIMISCSGFLKSDSSAEKKKMEDSGSIKIGAIYNLTGDQAALDAPSAKGAKLAVKKINEYGGVLGKKVELILEDGKTDLKNIRSIAESMAGRKEISAMIGFSDTDQVMAAAPAAAKAKIVFVTSGATSPKLPAQVPAWLFLACFGDNVQASAGAEFAFKNLKCKSAYLIIQNDMDYTILLAKYFKESYINLGGKINFEYNFKTSDYDFSQAIKKMKENSDNPEIIYVAAGPEKIGDIVKQLRESGYNQPILGGDSYDSPLLVKTAGKYAENVYFTTHCLLDPEIKSVKLKKFINEYNKNFDNEEPNAFAALGYDTVNLVINAIKNAGTAEPESVKNALAGTVKFSGITGQISYVSGSAIPVKGVTVVKIEDGKLLSAAEITPVKIPQP